MTIRAEASGVDAADFAAMLMRMYLRWDERQGYPTEVMDTSYAEEAGLKSAAFAVQVPYAYGVRISPFDNQGRRQTSFARSRGRASTHRLGTSARRAEHIDVPMLCLRTRWSRTCGPSTRSATPRRCSTAITMGSSGRASVGSTPATATRTDYRR